MISTWRKSSREFMGYLPLPPPAPPSTPRRSLRRPLPPLVGKNVRQDISSTNNALNNNNRISSARRRITTTTAMAAVAVVGVPPPPPLPPRVYGPPTSTLGSTLFKCCWVSDRSVSSNPTYVRRLCWLTPFPMALHHRLGYPSRHHLHLCPFTVVSSRLRRLLLRQHGPHGWAHGINSCWPTPSTP
jgi:hypothetical protein